MFDVLWTPGAQNLAESFTKHHSATCYQHMKAKYLHEPSVHSAHGSYHHGHCKGVLITMTHTTSSYHRSASSLYRLSYTVVTQHSHPACSTCVAISSQWSPHSHQCTVGSVRLGFIVESSFFQVADRMAGEEFSLFTFNLNNKGSFSEICVFLQDKQ